MNLFKLLFLEFLNILKLVHRLNYLKTIRSNINFNKITFSEKLTAKLFTVTRGRGGVVIGKIEFVISTWHFVWYKNLHNLKICPFEVFKYLFLKLLKKGMSMLGKSSCVLN